MLVVELLVDPIQKVSFESIEINLSGKIHYFLVRSVH